MNRPGDPNFFSYSPPYEASFSGSPDDLKVSYEVSDVALQRHAAEDLLAQLPSGTSFVVDVAAFTSADVEVKFDRGTYVVTLGLEVGLKPELYERALRYCVDLIVDHQRGRQPPTHDPTEAFTRFPTGTGLVDPRLVALGATADVYHATDPTLERSVAVKVFRDADQATVDRAIAEARRLGLAVHRCIPRLFRLGIVDGDAQQLPYLVQEWHAGKPLSNPDALMSFLSLSYGRRINHFTTICDAVYSLHRSGQAHGDIHGGNVLYDAASDTVTLIDLGSTPLTESTFDFGRADAQALGRLFLATVCVPSLPIYADLVTRIGSIRELQTLLKGFPLDSVIAAPPTPGELARHGEQRYVRMSEWLHRFRQIFEIGARVTFHHRNDLTEPLRLEFDQSSHRAVIECGASYDLHDEFRSFALVMLRIFLRDWTFRQRSGLVARKERRPSGEELPKGDRSQELRAGAGLRLDEMLSGIAGLDNLRSDPVSRLLATEPSERSAIGFFIYAQAFLEAAVVDWLRAAARGGLFGNFNGQQLDALDRLVEDRASFSADTLVPRLRQIAEVYQRSISVTEAEVLIELQRRCSRFSTWSNASFAVLVEGMSMLLSSCETRYVVTATDVRTRELKIHRCGTWRADAPWTSAAAAALRYADEDEPTIVEIGPSAMTDMAAIMAFERCARGLGSESFVCGRASVHGRVGVGNLFGLDDRLGVVDDGQWDAMVDSALAAATASEGGRKKLGVRIRELYEDFVSDIRRAKLDGRVAVNPGLSHEGVALLRSLGLITIENFANRADLISLGDADRRLDDLIRRDDEEVLDRWIEARIETTLDRLTNLLERF